MILGGGGCCFIVHVPVLKERWNPRCPSVEMDRLRSNVSSGGNLGSAYGGIRNCGSSVEAEHVWPVWDRQEQCAAERPLASGTPHPFHTVRQMPALCPAAGGGWNRQGLCRILGETTGETPKFSWLLCCLFSDLWSHVTSLERPSPITHSIVATHLPSLSIPCLLFFITFITTYIAVT